jgi:hypothetical protein
MFEGLQFSMYVREYPQELKQKACNARRSPLRRTARNQAAADDFSLSAEGTSNCNDTSQDA